MLSTVTIVYEVAYSRCRLFIPLEEEHSTHSVPQLQQHKTIYWSINDLRHTCI